MKISGVLEVYQCFKGTFYLRLKLKTRILRNTSEYNTSVVCHKIEVLVTLVRTLNATIKNKFVKSVTLFRIYKIHCVWLKPQP